MITNMYFFTKYRSFFGAKLKVLKVLSLYLLGLFGGILSFNNAAAQPLKGTSESVAQAVTGFIENKGQVIDQNSNPVAAVKYLLSLPGLNIQLKANSFAYDAYTISQTLRKSERELLPGELEDYDIHFKFHRIDIEFIGANPSPQLVTENAGREVFNYYTPGTPESGVLGVHHYGKVTYKNIYQGIDLEFVAKPGTKKPVEYNFIVHPGADASVIKWKYSGSNDVKLLNDLINISTIHGTISESIPLTYEKETSKTVSQQYKSFGNNVYGFITGEYNKENTLIIDPLPDLKWATYFGSTGIDYAYGLNYDASGNMYVTGATTSTSAIATSGAFQTTFGGTAGYGSGGDAYIVKFDASGNRVWATYCGGNNNEIGMTVGIDKSGNLYINGTTSSTTGMSTTGAFQTTQTGSYNDAFLAKFTNNGIRLWGTFFGGTGNDRGTQNGLAVDANANVYMTGTNNSAGTGITTAGVYQTTRSSTSAYDDAFAAKFDSSGSLIWGTYYGGPNHDIAYSINLDASGNVYLTGSAIAPSGIATSGSHQSTIGGGTDGFIAKLNPTGTALVWATYYGGTGTDVVAGLGIDATGNIYVSGYTGSSNAIATSGAYSATYGGGTYDGFVAKFTSAGVRLWGTYYGASGDDIPRSSRTDGSGNTYVAGDATSTTGIATSGAYQTAFAGGTRDIFLSKFDANGALLWGTYYGGSLEDLAWSIELGPSATIYMAGRTVSTSGIVTTGSFQSTFGGGTYDGFVAKFQELVGTNNAGINKFTSPDSYLCAGTRDVKVEIINSGLNTINTLNIAWEVDGVAQTPATISTALDPGKTREITLGAVNFTANVEKKIKVFTSMPNGVADTVNNNDTVVVFRKPGLSGTYTIGGTSPNYATFSAAITDLNTYGICGPVVFNAAAGTYTEKLLLKQVQGASATNTIMFKGAGKGSTKVSYAGTGTGDMATLMLSGTDHTTFRDMSIEATGATFGAGIWITDGADSNKFANMDINVDIASTSANVNGIVSSGSATAIGDGNAGSSLLFDSLTVNGGYYGLRLSGAGTTSSYASRNTVRNSSFSNQYQYGMYLRSQLNVLVSKNRIAPCRNATSYGMYFDYSAHLEVANNIIESIDNGMYFNYVNRYLYNPSIAARVFNNMVSSTSDYALYVNNTKYLKLWHNSFNADAAQSAARFVASDNMDLRNNHISSTSSSITPYALYTDNVSTFTEMDYNNYYSAGNFVFMGTNNYANLPILQAAFSAFNQNSVNRDPLFTSATDLHTSINISGIYVGVDEDIDGDFRNNVSPVVGADEVNVPNNAGISKLLSPVPVFCAGTQDVRVQIGNYGVNTIDSVRVYWEVNGVAQTTNYVSTSIATRGFLDVTLGSVTFAAGETKKIKVWTAFPNGLKDSLSNNDTLSSFSKTGLTGSYTVGGGSPDYPDFASAIFDLNVLGICGPVVFNVRSGTYSERLVFTEVRGASATNTITFKGAGKANTNLSYSGTSTLDWATLTVDGGDHYIFKDMTVSSMGATKGIGILITAQADSNTFRNITVQTSVTSTSQDIAGVALIPSATDLYGGSGIPGNGNLFDSLEVNGGYFGIYLYGGGANQMVSNCSLTDQYISGINCSNQEYLEVYRNKINPLRNTAFSYSLNLTQVSNFKVHANTVSASGDYGMYLQLVNFLGADPNYTSKIYNNIVSNTAGYAFYCENSQQISILHNSFRAVGTSSSFSAAGYFASCVNLDFRNNHIRNDNPNSYALEADGGTFDSLDYNNYYSFGNFVSLGTNYTNLANLKAGLPLFNQNSQSKDPQYLSLNNLHTSIFLQGIYVGIDKDIDGESRCPSKVSIGADDENQGFVKPVVATNHTDYYTKYPVRFSNNISSLPAVTFQWFVDGTYINDSVSFGHIFTTAGPHTVKLKAQRCIHFDSTDYIITIKPGTPATNVIGNSPDSIRVFNGYTDSGATAKNFFGTDITPTITTGNNIDTNVLGTYYIWYVVVDAWGNKDSVVRIVKVIDDVAPVLSLTGSDTISIEVFSDINEPGSSATDNYYSSVSIVVDSSTVNKNVVGIYPMVYTATDGSGNISTHTRWVKVIDTERPVITLIQNDTIIVKVNYPYFEPGAKVKDNYCKTGLVSDVDTFPNTSVLGDYLLTYTAEDCQGNVAIPVNRLVRVIDNEAPLLSLNGLPIVQIQRGATYDEAGVDIRDNYYDTALLRGLMVTTTGLDENVVGTYSVCYQVTDPSGNISNKICRTVTVLNNLGIGETAFDKGIKLYPNPTNGNFKVELPENAVGNIGITVTDVTGRVVSTSTIFDGYNAVQLNLETLSAGVYQVRLSQGNQNTTLRVNIIK